MNTIKTIYFGVLASLACAITPVCAQQPQGQYPRNHGRRHRLLERSAYNRGMMDYHTQHRLYCQRWCHLHRLLRPAILAAGRAAFTTGQSPLRTV